MLELTTTATFDKLFSKLPKSVQRKASTKTDLFRENPFHPSLRTEKLHPKHHEVWRTEVWFLDLCGLCGAEASSSLEAAFLFARGA